MLVILASETFLVSPTVIVLIKASTSLRCGSSKVPSGGMLQILQNSANGIFLTRHINETQLKEVIP